MLWVQLSTVLVLIFFNGFFALAEMAVVTARKAPLHQAAASGLKGAQIALDLKGESGRFLSTVQVGTTLVVVLTSVFGGAALASRLATVFESVPGWGRYGTSFSIAIVAVAISYFTLILGELVPKRIALSRPELIAARVSRGMRLIGRIFSPAECLLSISSNAVLWLMGIRTTQPSPVTDEEIALIMREATAAGDFEAAETAIVQMALRLDNRRVAAVMIPRTKIEWLSLADSEEESRRKIRESSFSRFPVLDGGWQQILGFVQVKDLLSVLLGGQSFDLKGAVRPSLYLPNNITVLRALEIFKRRGDPLALVIDEYGEVEGLVTLHDILQSLVGDIAGPGADESPPVVRRDDGSWLVEGMVAVDELADLTGLAELRGIESHEFHTVGGLIMARLGRVPVVGDCVVVAGCRLEVMNMDNRRVERVLMTASAGSADAIPIETASGGR